MPTYLVHGFRWSRRLIRIHIAMYDLDDAAAEWIVLPASAITLLNSFYTICDFLPPSQAPRIGDGSGHDSSSNLPHSSLTPSQGIGGAGALGKPISGADTAKAKCSANPHQKFNEWSAVKLLEQYDPEDETTASQPYAYVADYIREVKLSLDLAAEMTAYEERDRDIRSIVDSAAKGKGTGFPASPISPLKTASSNGQIEEGKRPESVVSYANDSSSDLQNHNRNMSGRDVRRLSRQVGWIEKLRNLLDKEAEIGWYVVKCDDADRVLPPEVEAAMRRDEDDEEDEYWDDGQEAQVKEEGAATSGGVPRRGVGKGKPSKEREKEKEKGGTLRGLFERNKERLRGKIL